MNHTSPHIPKVPPPSEGGLHAQFAALCAAHPTQRCEINGHRWNYVKTGSETNVRGVTLLLLPGALGEADTSFQYILALQDAYPIVSVGYPPTLDQLPALLGGLHTLLEQLHIGEAHVVGGSYSGPAAQHFAALYPQHVRSLLLANTGAPAPAQGLLWQLAAAAVQRLPEGPLQLVMRMSIQRFLPGDSPAERFWRSYFAAALPRWSKGAVVARLRLMGQMHATEEAARLRQRAFGGPVLLIDAAEDRLVSARQRQGLQALYPQARHVVIKDKGHTASLDEAGTYIQIYREFLCNLPTQPPRQDAP